VPRILPLGNPTYMRFSSHYHSYFFLFIVLQYERYYFSILHTVLKTENPLFWVVISWGLLQIAKKTRKNDGICPFAKSTLQNYNPNPIIFGLVQRFNVIE